MDEKQSPSDYLPIPGTTPDDLAKAALTGGAGHRSTPDDEEEPDRLPGWITVAVALMALPELLKAVSGTVLGGLVKAVFAPVLRPVGKVLKKHMRIIGWMLFAGALILYLLGILDELSA